MKILSWNINGLRSALRHDFTEWLASADPDVLCLQEIKTQAPQPPDDLFGTSDYYCFANCGDRKGRAGVAVYTKEQPQNVNRLLGHPRFDREGRFIELQFPRFNLLNFYLPHGGRKKEHLPYKLEVYRVLIEYLKKHRRASLILAGDLNIAHTEIDLARPKQNKNNIMFTLEERQQLGKIVGLGFVDSFRHLHPQEKRYTWLSYLKSAREKNLGWRLDYIFTSQSLRRFLTDAFIIPYPAASDHCPVGVTISPPCLAS